MCINVYSAMELCTSARTVDWIRVLFSYVGHWWSCWNGHLHHTVRVAGFKRRTCQYQLSWTSKNRQKTQVWSESMFVQFALKDSNKKVIWMSIWRARTAVRQIHRIHLHVTVVSATCTRLAEADTARRAPLQLQKLMLTYLQWCQLAIYAIYQTWKECSCDVDEHEDDASEN